MCYDTHHDRNKQLISWLTISALVLQSMTVSKKRNSNSLGPCLFASCYCDHIVSFVVLINPECSIFDSSKLNPELRFVISAVPSDVNRCPILLCGHNRQPGAGQASRRDWRAAHWLVPFISALDLSLLVPFFIFVFHNAGTCTEPSIFLP